MTWWFGEFYTGHLNELQVTSSWKPSPLFIIDLNGTVNVGDLPEGQFTQVVMGTRFRLNLSPDLQVTSFVQYDHSSHEMTSKLAAALDLLAGRRAVPRVQPQRDGT